MGSIALGIDVEAIERDQRFFKILTNRWPAKVYVMMWFPLRNIPFNEDAVIQSLKDDGIRTDGVIPVQTHAELLAAIADKGIAYYYQCNDRVIELPLSLKVFRMLTNDQSASLVHLDDPS